MERTLAIYINQEVVLYQWIHCDDCIGQTRDDCSICVSMDLYDPFPDNETGEQL